MKVLPAATLTVALFVAACGNEQAEPPADVADPTAALHALFDEFFERGLELNPMRASTIGDYRFNDQFANSIGPEHREASRQLDEVFVARLLNIDREQLSRQDRLSYDIFRFNREQSLEGERFPGHHFQRSLQVENADLPSFRRFGGSAAFTEGWGLYAETLGKEIGVYTDPYQYFGALNGELWRAIRLVVDTGLHAKEWTRQDVLDFMYTNSAVKEARAVSEAERVIAFPGQVLAYKIGQLKISELRDDAEERLGDQFDVKAFHAQVLMDGPMPLSLLEDKIGDWVVSQL